MMLRAEGGKLFDDETGEELPQHVCDDFHVGFLHRFSKVTPLDVAIIGGWTKVKKRLEHDARVRRCGGCRRPISYGLFCSNDCSEKGMDG